jgi:hypothetical protein
MIQWELKGRQLNTCNCDSGCPCQFNSLPTNGNCSAIIGIQVDEGRFGAVKLDGVRVVAILTWPGAIHEGRGKAQIVVDESASEQQREAMLKILSGQETEPGATVFNVFATTLERVFDPVFKPIEMEIDVERRRGRFSVEGLAEAEGSPILNPITGQEHRARIDLPQGFEYRVAEVGKARSKSTIPLPLSFTDTHAHFAKLHMTQSGVVG